MRHIEEAIFMLALFGICFMCGYLFHAHATEPPPKCAAPVKESLAMGKAQQARWITYYKESRK